jgi:hypothetical protein
MCNLALRTRGGTRQDVALVRVPHDSLPPSPPRTSEQPGLLSQLTLSEIRQREMRGEIALA